MHFKGLQTRESLLCLVPAWVAPDCPPRQTTARPVQPELADLQPTLGGSSPRLNQAALSLKAFLLCFLFIALIVKLRTDWFITVEMAQQKVSLSQMSYEARQEPSAGD